VRAAAVGPLPAETVARLTKDYPQIPQFTVQSQHDIPRMAPDALIAHVKKFLG
jgi:hypothetical protein